MKEDVGELKDMPLVSLHQGNKRRAISPAKHSAKRSEVEQVAVSTDIVIAMEAAAGVKCKPWTGKTKAMSKFGKDETSVRGTKCTGTKGVIVMGKKTK